MAYHWCPRNPPDPLILNSSMIANGQKKRQKKNGGLNPQKTTKNGGLNPKKTTLFNKITFQIPPKKKDSQKRC